MLFKKNTFVFVLLALLAVEEISSYSVHEPVDDSIDDLIKKAKEAIQHMAKEIDEAVKKGVAKLKDAFQTIDASVKYFVNKAEKAITFKFQDVKEHAEKLIKEAEMLGANATICLEEHKDAIEHLPLDIIFKMSECISDELDIVEKMIADTIEDMKAYYNKLVDLPEQLKKCRQDHNNEAVCIGKFIEGLLVDTFKFVTEIVSIVNAAIDAVFNVKTDLKNCVIDKLKESGIEAAKIAALIAKCVADKINHLQYHEKYYLNLSFSS